MKQQDRYPDQYGYDKIISPITLKMKKGTWEIFKSITPRNIKLNEAILQIIHKKIVEETEDVHPDDLEQWNKDQEYWAERKVKKKKKRTETTGVKGK